MLLFFPSKRQFLQPSKQMQSSAGALHEEQEEETNLNNKQSNSSHDGEGDDEGEDEDEEAAVKAAVVEPASEAVTAESVAQRLMIQVNGEEEDEENE